MKYHTYIYMMVNFKFMCDIEISLIIFLRIDLIYLALSRTYSYYYLREHIWLYK